MKIMLNLEDLGSNTLEGVCSDVEGKIKELRHSKADDFEIAYYEGILRKIDLYRNYEQ